MIALRNLDLVLLAVALVVFLVADLPLGGWLTAAGIWAMWRGIGWRTRCSDVISPPLMLHARLRRVQSYIDNRLSIDQTSITSASLAVPIWSTSRMCRSVSSCSRS